MNPTLILNISLLENNDNFSEEKKLETENQQNAVRHIRQGGLQIRFNQDHYELMQGENIMKLTESESISLGQLVINFQIEKVSSIFEEHCEVLSSGSVQDNQDVNYSKLQPDFWLTQLDHHSVQAEFDVMLSEQTKNDPLAFLYAVTPIEQEKAKTPFSPVIHETNPLVLISQHFQAPNMQLESSSIVVIQPEDIVNQSKNNAGNVLSDLGIHDEKVIY